MRRISMRIPYRLPHDHPVQRVAIATLLALVSALLVVAAPAFRGIEEPLARLDGVLYDSFYRSRPVQSQVDGPLVIVAADDDSLARMAAGKKLGWPWPRDQWAAILRYVQKCGAKAVAFDILFSEPSVYRDTFDDDAILADAADEAKVPVVFGVLASKDDPGRLAPKVRAPIRGATNILSEPVLRTFLPFASGRPSLAAAVVASLGRPADVPAEPFLLHYYGPHVGGGGAHTFQYVHAVDVIDAFMGDPAAAARAPPSLFAGKIVVVGATTAGTYDLKVTPLSSIYPGVEVQATAVTNMLRRQHVQPLGAKWSVAAVLLAALAGGLGAGLPRPAAVKLACAAAAVVAPLLVSAALFHGETIRWLPPAGPLVAGILADGGALAWSYLVEDRRRRFFLKALSQYVSPAVADELSRDRAKLRIGSERREMTVLFSDIAGFTDLSEKLEPEALGHLLNFYLNEMSAVVLGLDGTLDKYIGDAIVTFWNAPLTQPDHAVRAVRAAIAMRKREAEIGDQLAALGGAGMHTRIGVNSGPMAVGNMGSSQKFNYSVLGDAVNLGARLEGANKLYGTRILISQFTADLVKGQFLMRKVDILRVKGKLRPISVYEPFCEGSGTADEAALAAEYEAALACYQSQNWNHSEKHILAVRALMPHDGPAKTLSQRIAVFRREPPPVGWDGVFVAREK